MVSSAATEVRLNSSPSRANRPTVVTVSWISATTAPMPYCHSKRNQM